MHTRNRLSILLFVLGAIVALIGGALHGCDDEGDDECCAPGCIACFCCMHQPPCMGAAGAPSARGGADSLAPLTGPVAASPPPQEILHVPIPARMS